MIERLIERDGNGLIGRILDRTLPAPEEAWARVRAELAKPESQGKATLAVIALGSREVLTYIRGRLAADRTAWPAACREIVLVGGPEADPPRPAPAARPKAAYVPTRKHR